MTLSIQDKKRYKAIGHRLQPVVTIAGRGLEDSVMAELERALNDHELIKIKLAAEDRQQRAALLEQIRSLTGAELVQITGAKALIFRPAAKPNPKLSNLQRFKVF